MLCKVLEVEVARSGVVLGLPNPQATRQTNASGRGLDMLWTCEPIT